MLHSLFSILPQEVVEYCFSFLEAPEEYAVLRQVCKKLRDFLIQPKPSVSLGIAVFCNSIPRLEWARRNGYDWSRDHSYPRVLVPFTHCQFDLVRCKLFNKMYPVVTIHVIVRRDLDTLKWLINNGCRIHPDSLLWAIASGDIQAVKWLRKQCLALTACACAIAAFRGDLDTLEWLRQQQCPWDWRTVRCAMISGHFEIVKWAVKEGCYWDTSEQCERFCSAGNIAMMKLARTHGYVWDSYCTTLAAEEGHLHMVQWLRKKGCPWGTNTIARAIAQGHLDIAAWARANGCPDLSEV